jgi:hypothetical protein
LAPPSALAMVLPVRKVGPTCTGIIRPVAVSIGSLPVWYLNGEILAFGSLIEPAGLYIDTFPFSAAFAG